jgi:hypothetical protein
MRRYVAPLLVLVGVVGLLLALPMTAASTPGGLSPAQLNDHGWTCFNVDPPGPVALGVHCAAPGQEWPPTGPTAQLLYFFTEDDPESTVPSFTGTETLLRDDKYHGQPCPTEPSGEYGLLGSLAPGGPVYWGCHRN